MVHVRTAVLTQADGARWSLSSQAHVKPAWTVEDVAGWYGGTGVRGGVTARLGHGDFVERGYREGRVLTLHGMVDCETPDDRDWQERNLSGMAWSGEWADLTCDDGNAVLSTRVRLDGAPQVTNIGTRVLRFQLPLVSDDAFLHGAWRETTLRPVGAGVGLDYPSFSVDMGQGPILTYGTAIDTTEYVWNEGNATSYPQFVVYADAPGGFTVGIGDRRVSYPWPCFQDMPVTVDMSGSLSVSGVDQSHMLGSRQWAGVAPGLISSPSLSFIQGGNGWATARHRDTYV